MNEEIWKRALTKALQELGVETAGKRDDPLRWSGTDLATDLAPLVQKWYYEERYTFPEGKK